MKANEIKELLKNGGLNKYSSLYKNIDAQTERMIAAIDAFTALYGDDRDISVFSVPGRTEVMGNHTDHNRGCVLAAAIDRDIRAVAAANTDGVIRFKSEGYPESVIDLSVIDEPSNFESYTSSSLIAGLARGFENADHAIGGVGSMLLRRADQFSDRL